MVYRIVVRMATRSCFQAAGQFFAAAVQAALEVALVVGVEEMMVAHNHCQTRCSCYW